MAFVVVSMVTGLCGGQYGNWQTVAFVVFSMVTGILWPSVLVNMVTGRLGPPVLVNMTTGGRVWSIW